MDHIIEIDFVRCCRAVFRRIPVLLLALVLGLLAGFGTSRVLVEQENNYNVYSEVLVSDIYMVPLCAELLKTDDVTQRAVSLLDGAYTASQVNALVQASYRDNVIASIPVIKICAISQDPEKTAVLVEAVTEAYIAELRSLTGQEIVMRVGNPSNVELLYNAKQSALVVILGTAFLFVALSMAVIVLREILALQLTSVKDGLLGGQLKLIGVIPRYKK